MRYLERSILLQVTDTRWREHLYDMDYLREGIHLRGFAQIDPLVAYKNEGFSMFEELMHSIWEEFSRLIFHVEVDIAPSDAEQAFAPPSDEPTSEFDYSGGGAAASQPSALREAAAAGGAGAAAETAVAASSPPGHGGNGGVDTKVNSDRENIGRNDPCWCGSGKKFKKCHGA
jgi:preprotein translocase subunit SecA